MGIRALEAINVLSKLVSGEFRSRQVPLWDWLSIDKASLVGKFRIPDRFPLPCHGSRPSAYPITACGFDFSRLSSYTV